MSLRQWLFASLARLAKVSEMASRAFLFLGIGVLNRSDVNELSRRSWSAFAQTDDEARSGFTLWEEATFRQFVKAGQRLCIVGCGSGRDLLPFVREGHDVVGIEPSPAPAAMLRRILHDANLSATVIEARVEDAVLPGLFDVVLFSLNCYSYIHGSAARVAVLRKLEEHLASDGRIFLTYPRRRGRWVNRSARLASLTARLTRSDWRLEPYDFVQRIDVAGEPGAAICEHFFLPEEIEREAERSGLRVLVHGDPWSTAYAVLGRGPG